MRSRSLSDSTQFVGLDVHAKTIAIAVAQEGRDEPKFLSTTSHGFTRFLMSLDRLGSLDGKVVNDAGQGLEGAVSRSTVRTRSGWPTL